MKSVLKHVLVCVSESRVVGTSALGCSHYYRNTGLVRSAMFWNSATRTIAVKLNTLTTQIPPPPRADDEAPRKILLVQAHPCSDSFSAAIADAVVTGAKEGGHAIRRRSLYQEKYQPVITAKERTSYFDTVKGALRLNSDTKSHLADLYWCDSLVLVYPTWWFNMPAMLKGYFDRTFVPGPKGEGAWDFPKGAKDPEAASNGLVPRLTNVKRMLGISTCASARLTPLTSALVLTATLFVASTWLLAKMSLSRRSRLQTVHRAPLHFWLGTTGATPLVRQSGQISRLIAPAAGWASMTWTFALKKLARPFSTR